VDRLTRKELKSDHFVQEVGHTVEYVSEHRQQVYRWGGIALGAIVVIAAVWFWMSSSKATRQDDLRQALRLQDAAVGQGNPSQLTYPTQQAKDEAVKKAMQNLASKYGSKDEGMIATYYLGVLAADNGNLAEAEKHWKEVADKAAKNYASQAKLSLAQLYAAQNKVPESEKLLRSLMDNPTDLVSKEQAIIALARIKAKDSPQEARKLLEPLRSEKRAAVSRAAITALNEIR
jgi:predicted negative regulator of RcsB-dependent stress response